VASLFAVSGRRERVRFSRSQWADLIVLIVVLWGQLIVYFIWGDDNLWLVLLFLVLNAVMLVKIYRWILPLWREQRGPYDRDV
jgi:hypothetical protein